MELLKWKGEVSLNSSENIKVLKAQIIDAQQQHLVDAGLIRGKEIELRKEIANEEDYWRSKSRVEWLRSGDKNTAFFHAQVNQRRSNNKIQGLYNESGDWVCTEDGIQKVVLDYFTDIFTSSNPSSTEAAVVGLDTLITLEINQLLMAEVTIEEIKMALMQFNPSKCLGLDGMTAAFYQKNWEVVGMDVYHAVDRFFFSEWEYSEIHQ